MNGEKSQGPVKARNTPRRTQSLIRQALGAFRQRERHPAGTQTRSPCGEALDLPEASDARTQGHGGLPHRHNAIEKAASPARPPAPTRGLPTG